MKNFFYRTIREYIFNMLFHHFSKISLRISYKKIYIYFQHNHNTTTNIRKFTLIYCFQLFYKSLSPMVPITSIMVKGSSSESCFIFVKKILSLSESLYSLIWLYNKDLWHWPSCTHLAFFLVINLERHSKYTEQKILLLGDSHC